MDTIEQGEQSLLRLLHADADPDASSRLLRAIWGGYPAEDLERLLRSNVDSAVRAGAWVLSELGHAPATVQDLLTDLLSSQDPAVRRDILDVVMVESSSLPAETLAKAAELVGDPIEQVRNRAAYFVATADATVLRRAEAATNDSALSAEIARLLSLEGRPVASATIAAMAADSRPLTRLFAAIVARRHAEEGFA